MPTTAPCWAWSTLASCTAGGKKATRKSRPFGRKESYRWLAATKAAARLIPAGAARVTMVADREGDICEEFARCPAGVDLLIRAAQDRCLSDGRMPFDAAREAPALGQMTIDLPAAPGRRARTATLQLRACRVELARPRRSAAEAARLPASVTLTLLDAREIEPPRGRRAGALGAADPCPRALVPRDTYDGQPGAGLHHHRLLPRPLGDRATVPHL